MSMNKTAHNETLTKVIEFLQTQWLNRVKEKDLIPFYHSLIRHQVSIENGCLIHEDQFLNLQKCKTVFCIILGNSWILCMLWHTWDTQHRTLENKVTRSILVASDEVWHWKFYENYQVCQIIGQNRQSQNHVPYTNASFQNLLGSNWRLI